MGRKHLAFEPRHIQHAVDNLMQAVGALQDAVHGLRERRVFLDRGGGFEHTHVALDDRKRRAQFVRRNLDEVAFVLVEFFEAGQRAVEFVHALFDHALHHLVEARSRRRTAARFRAQWTPEWQTCWQAGCRPG